MAGQDAESLLGHGQNGEVCLFSSSLQLASTVTHWKSPVKVEKHGCISEATLLLAQLYFLHNMDKLLLRRCRAWIEGCHAVFISCLHVAICRILHDGWNVRHTLLKCATSHRGFQVICKRCAWMQLLCTTVLCLSGHIGADDKMQGWQNWLWACIMAYAS